METTTTSSFWFVLTACIGGFVALIGILMEVLVEKKWFKNINDFRWCESVKHWGEILLIIGVAIEVVVAGLAAEDEWQIRQMAIKNNPLNQRISDLSAFAYFEVNDENGPDLVETNRFSWGQVADLMIGYSNTPLLSVFPMLQADVFLRGRPQTITNGRSYFLRFNESGMSAMMVGYSNKLFEVKELNAARYLYLTFRFLTNNAEIENGDVELIANGNVRYTFKIPRQIPFKQFANSPSDAPLWIIATNSVEVFNRK